MDNIVNLLLVGLLLYGLYQLWSAWRESTLAKRLEVEGKSIQAEITDRWSARGRFSAASYYAIYTFTTNGLDGDQTYEHQQQVSPTNYEKLTVGVRPTVKYLADNPESSARLSGEFADRTGFSARLLSGVILLIVTSVMLVLAAATH